MGFAESAIPIFLFIVACVVGAVYLASQIRKGDLQILRDANKDLRERQGDMEKTMTEFGLQLNQTKAKLSMVESNYKQLQDIILVALDQYFAKNPETAKMMSERFRE